MAKIGSVERDQLRAPQRRGATPAPPPPVLPAREYVAFATFAARFLPTPKSKPAFEGRHWKL